MFSDKVQRLRKTFHSQKTKSLSWRKNQLSALLRMMKENKQKLCDAVYEDLHKSPEEAELFELMIVQNEIIDHLENIHERSKIVECERSLLSILNKVCIRKEPYGVVLIIGAWNYPFLLTLQPLVGAIATGNCAILKPSEVSPASAKLLEELIPKYLDEDCFSVVVCGPKESNDLVSNHTWDLIFYTGNSHVGKLIMQAAAKSLTPIVLELGGKNPCYIDKSCDLDSTARRLVWGKWINCGQTCVCPDYVLCEAHMRSPLIEKLKGIIEEYFGEDPRKSNSYNRIINERHVKRLEGLLDGVDVVHGGVIDEKEKYFSPTIVVDVKEDAPIRKEEVFGPILPIYTVNDVEEAIEFMNLGEKSLQLSIFATDRRVIDRVVAETSSGGVTVNEFFMQMNEMSLPFGGVGASGMGAYHGRYSFDAFCYKRSYYECHTPELINRLRYPPYSEGQLKLLRPVAYKMGPIPKPIKALFRLSMMAAMGVLIAYLVNLLK